MIKPEIKLLEITIRNFLSYGNNTTRINLNFTKPTLIVGRNLDASQNDEIDSNGAGKSTILNAVSVCLFDKPISKILKKNYINNINKKNMEISITFQKGSKFYTIERYRNKTKLGDGVLLHTRDSLDEPINYEVALARAANENTDEEIEKIIGIPYEIFSRIVVFFSKTQPFLELELPDQRNVIEELFGYTELTKKGEVLSSKITKDKRDLQELISLNDQIIKEHDRHTTHKKSILDKINEWNVVNTTKKAKLETQINNLSLINFDEQEQYLNKIDELNKELTTLDVKINDNVLNFKTVKTNITNIKNWETTKLENISKLKLDISNIPSQKELDDYKQQLVYLNDHTAYLNLLEVSNVENMVNLKTLTTIHSNVLSWVDNYNKNTSRLKAELDSYMSVEELEKTKPILQEIESLNQKLKQLNFDKITTETEISTEKPKLNILCSQIEHLESAKCPYCLQNFEESKNKLPLIIIEKQSLQDSIDSIVKRLETVQTSILDVSVNIIKLKDLIKFTSMEDVIKYESNLKLTQQKYNTAINEVNPHLAKEITLAMFMEEYSGKLPILEKYISEFNTKIKTTTDNINKLLTTLNVPFFSEFIDIPKNINKLLEKITGTGTKISVLIDKLTNEENSKNPYIQDTTLEDLEILKSSLFEVLKTLGEDKVSLEENIQSIIKLLTYKTLKELYDNKNILTSLSNEFSNLSKETNPHSSTFDELERIKLDDLKTDQINELSKLIDHENFLLKILTKKDSFVRKALLQKNTPYLNTRIKYYLEKIRLPHKVEFLQDMTVKISQFKTEFPFNNLSSGQKARLNLALSFAFRDVLQSRFGIINLCILDEVLDDGLSNVGVTNAVKMLKAVASDNNLSMLIISHKDEISSMFDSKLEIELKGGFSNVVRSDI